jgi:gamma-glutamyl-gamma-aminobutyrate hydrolase PuuD
MNGDYDIKPVALFVPDLRRDPERKRDPNYREGDPTYREDHGYWTEIYGKAISAMGLRYKLLYAGDVVDNNGKVDLSAFSGVIISGGRDADPARYGARRHRKTEPPDGGRDKEIHVVYEAMKQGLPLLGICRGMQVIAAAAGCTITQHRPDYLGKESDIVHNQKAQRKYNGTKELIEDPHRGLAASGPVLVPRRRKWWRPDTWRKASLWFLDTVSGVTVPERKFAPGHVVEVVPDTWLARLTGVRSLRTNAWHHQGLFVDGLADGVRAAAKTPDGVVEAIELGPELIDKMTTGKRKLLSFLGGVQWHPEGLSGQHRPHAAILAGFGDAVKLTEKLGPEVAALLGPHGPKLTIEDRASLAAACTSLTVAHTSTVPESAMGVGPGTERQENLIDVARRKPTINPVSRLRAAGQRLLGRR